MGRRKSTTVEHWKMIHGWLLTSFRLTPFNVFSSVKETTISFENLHFHLTSYTISHISNLSHRGYSWQPCAPWPMGKWRKWGARAGPWSTSSPSTTSSRGTMATTAAPTSTPRPILRIVSICGCVLHGCWLG